MDEGLYQVSLDVGNWGGKGTRDDGREVVIRNVAARYERDNLDDHLGGLSAGVIDDSDANDDTVSAVISFVHQETGDRLQQWIVGTAAEKENMRTRQKTSEHRIGSDEWYALVAALMVKLYGSRGGSVSLTASLPVNAIRQGYIHQMRDDLAGVWTIEHEGRVLSYNMIPDLIDVIPEGFGTLAYLCFSPSGKQVSNRQLAESNSAIIDFGGWTMDVLTYNTILKRGPVSQSYESGIIDVRNKVEQYILNKHGGRRWKGNDLDTVIRTGRYRISGAEEDITDVVMEALRDLKENALRVWRELLDSGRPYDAVIITGGVGPAVWPYLEPEIDHKNVLVLPAGEAHLANVRGALRFRRFQAQAQPQRG